MLVSECGPDNHASAKELPFGRDLSGLTPEQKWAGPSDRFISASFLTDRE